MTCSEDTCPLVELLADAAVVEGKVGVDEAEGVGMDEAEAAHDCACLARFLAAAFVCQLHEHGLLTEDVTKDPCRHFLLAMVLFKYATAITLFTLHSTAYIIGLRSELT